MKTVKKALAILNSFTLEVRTQGVTEIAKRLGFHKSTTFSLLSTLRQEGYIVYDPETRKYSLGLRLLDLAERVQYRRELKEVALPILKDLSKSIEEDVALNTFIEGKRVCIALVESRYFVRNLVPVGKALPLHCSAAGKVLMAYRSTKEIDDLIARQGLTRFTRHTITKKDKLLAELRRIRERGYGESREEYGSDAASVAFPVSNRKGEIVASLSIQSTVNRLNDKARTKFLKQGLNAAEKIGRLLAG